MKHEFLLEQVVENGQVDPNTLGVLVFGSVATGTHREDSDLDIMLVYRSYEPTSGIENVEVEGIKVGKTFFTYEILSQNVDTVPYLLHIVGNAKLLFDRDGTVEPLLEKIQEYFESNPDAEEEWNRIYDRFREEKRQFGYEQTSLIEVWNGLESQYSSGEVKRTFFRQFG